MLSFTAACLGLCLGCAGGTPMFWLLLSSACVVSRLSPPHVFPREWAGHEQEVGRSQLRQLTQIDQKDTACHTTIIPSANWGKAGSWEVAIAWRLAEYWSACGRYWVIAFASLVWGFFWLSFLHLLNFVLTPELPFVFQFSFFPTEQGVCEWLWALSWWLGPTHHKYLKNSILWETIGGTCL